MISSAVSVSDSVRSCGATAGRQVQLNLWPFFVKQQKLVGSYGRTRAEALERVREEIRFRWEMCPCSGVKDDFVELQVAPDS